VKEGITPPRIISVATAVLAGLGALATSVGVSQDNTSKSKQGDVKTAEAKKTDEKKSAPKAVPAEKTEPPARKIGAGKLYGTLTVNPQGGALITFAGSAQPRQIGAYNLPVTGDSGTVEVGDSATAYKVQLDYLRSGSALNVKVSTSPWAIIWVDGTSRGRAPVSGVKLESRQTLLELKKPGEDTGMTIKLQYRPN